MEQPKVLVIDRKTWLRGTGLDSCLRDHDGRMCCLGFDAVALGVDPKLLVGATVPSDLEDYETVPMDYVRERIRGSYDSDDPICNAMKHNDNETLAESDREALIREDLKLLGYDDVTFIN